MRASAAGGASVRGADADTWSDMAISPLLRVVFVILED